ncbi:unnamed protein product [Polarella glacialis]|uniref:Uncharacterized protein n=1 Tax=Polarella glacialis TaxID=89957 RepID=A0A813JLD4_POLGL|nr:unnamed protein product [Polarella glacialis]
MGAAACSSAPKCTLIPDIGCEQSNRPGASCPVHPDGLLCFIDEDREPDPDSPLKEFTHAFHASMMNSAQDEGNVSHRSNMSEVERQNMFLKRKIEVSKQRAERRAACAREPLACKAQPDASLFAADAARRAETLQQKYLTLGINVVR